jgi:hypothetical protein
MSAPSTVQAAKVLAKVPKEKAFWFYTGVDSPTQICADDLESFLNIVKEIEIKSIDFHMGREDFENWIRMLGDEILARQVANLKQKRLIGEPMRKRLLQTLQLRYGWLRKLASVQVRE